MLGHSILWSGLGAVALAVGVGVQLGESAVSQIDPLYFQGPAIHPRDRGAALDPNNLPGPIVSPYLQAYDWAQGNAALAAYSGGQSYPYAPDPEPAVQRLAETQWEVVEVPAAQPWPAGQVSENPEIERYARYPIEEKRGTVAQPAAAEEPPAPVRVAARPVEALSTASVLVYDE
ncbi:MAG TPA: hypothetical protein VEW04_02835 [Allosphingosinicella sp.]|nr:hypothetical protein [Allosphingosinicella sp.]